MTAGVTGQTTHLKVVGTYRKTHPSSTYWYTASSSASQSAGLAITGASALAAFDSTPTVYWTIRPNLSSLNPDQIEPLLHGLGNLVPPLSNNSAFNVRGVLSDGELQSTLRTISAGLRASRAIGSVPLVLIAITSLVALFQVAKLLAAARQDEYALLRVRGISARQVTGLTIFEAATVAAAGCVVGSCAGLVADWVATGTLRTSPLLPFITAGVFVASTAIVATSGVRGGRRRRDTGVGVRVESAVAAGSVLLVCIAAVISLTRFRAVTGSSIDRAASAADPLVIATPGLVLLALALLALLAFGPVSRLCHRISARRPSLLPALPLAQVSRRILTFAVPVVLTVFAVGGLTLAASYSGSWQPAQRSSALLENGAAVRITPSHDAATESRELSQVVPDTVPVLIENTELNNSAVTLTSIPRRAVTAVMPNPAGVSMSDLQQKLSLPGPAPLHGIPLPSSARKVSLSVTLTASLNLNNPRWRDLGWQHFGSFQSQTRITVANGHGSLAVLDLQPIALTKALRHGPQNRHTTLTARLPATDGSWRIVALDSSIGATFGPGSYKFSVDDLHSVDRSGHAAAVDIHAVDWKPQPDASTPGYRVRARGFGYAGKVVDSTKTSTVRLMPPGPRLPVPAIVSQSALPLIDKHVGDIVHLADPSAPIDATIVDAVPVVPGTTTKPAVLTDLAAYEDSLLRAGAGLPQPNEIWAASDRPEQTESRVLGVDPAATVSTPDSGVSKELLTPVNESFWAGAIGSLLLTTTAIIAFELSLWGRRRTELISLRAVGVSLRQLIVSRRVELLGVTSAATAAGMVAGAVVAIGVVAGLTRSAIPRLPAESTVPLHLDLWWWLASIIFFLILLGLISLISGIRTRREYTDTDIREVGPHGA